MSTNADGSVDKLYIQVSGHHGFVVFDWDTRQEINRITQPDVPPEERYDSTYMAHRLMALVYRPTPTLWSTSRMNSYVYVYSLPELELVASIPTGTESGLDYVYAEQYAGICANAVSIPYR